MATIKCGCYGTLGSIAGPMQHCPPPPADSSYYQNFPFYNGPCPPGPNLPCCKPCRPCGCRPCLPYPPEMDIPTTNRIAALLTAGAPQDVSAGSAVQLTAQLINPEYFAPAQGGIAIRRAGLYMAIFCINLPPLQTIGTNFVLRLNGTAIDASRIALTCTSDNNNTCVTGQALVQATPNCLLTLNTESALSIDVPSAVENVFSLSIVRIAAG